MSVLTPPSANQQHRQDDAETGEETQKRASTQARNPKRRLRSSRTYVQSSRRGAPPLSNGRTAMTALEVPPAGRDDRSPCRTRARTSVGISTSFRKALEGVVVLAPAPRKRRRRRRRGRGGVLFIRWSERWLHKLGASHAALPVVVGAAREHELSRRQHQQLRSARQGRYLQCFRVFLGGSTAAAAAAEGLLLLFSGGDRARTDNAWSARSTEAAPLHCHRSERQTAVAPELFGIRKPTHPSIHPANQPKRDVVKKRVLCEVRNGSRGGEQTKTTTMTTTTTTKQKKK